MSNPLKAIPPKSISNPALAPGQFTCVVSWDSGLGSPAAALLMPLALDGTNKPTGVVKLDGTLFGPADALGPTTVEITQGTLVPCFPDSATLTCDWPGETDHALLLLIHQQEFDIGSHLGELSHITFPIRPYAIDPSLMQIHAGQATLRSLPLINVVTEADTEAAATFFLHLPSRDLVPGCVPPPRASLDFSRMVNPRPEPLPESGAQPHKAFALASCQYPATLIDRGINAPWWGSGGDETLGPAERSMAALGDLTLGDTSIEFTVLAGDQVYVDATAGLFDPANLLDKFKFAYDAMCLNKGFQRVVGTPNQIVLPVLDDHEIADNWEPAAPAKADEIESEAYRGIKNYLSNEQWRWPSARNDPSKLWEQRLVKDWNFFFADTRTAREGRWVGNWRTASILGARQDEALLRWIGDPLSVAGVDDVDPPADAPAADGRPRFVVSPSILLPRLLSLRGHPTMALHADSWCGYPASLRRVLARLYVTRARGVVFLSGDEHLSCAAVIEITRNDSDDVLRTHSVHSSALYAPYPFANSRQEDFPIDDSFEFDDPFHPADQAGPPLAYRCTVATTFPERGDGFAILRPSPADAGWQVRVEFHRPGKAPDVQTLVL